MKKFLLTFVLLCLFLISCSVNKSVINEYGAYSSVGDGIGTQAIISEKYSLDRKDFNILCKRFDIPSDIHIWKEYSFNDYETKDEIKELVFIHPQNSREIFRLKLEIQKKDTTFNIIRRCFVEK